MLGTQLALNIGGDAHAGTSCPLAPGVLILPAFAGADAHETSLLADLRAVLVQAPPRHMWTAGGRRISVAMTNCGRLGWISDLAGYRYDPTDPEGHTAWPAMPASFAKLAAAAANRAGFVGFAPDACLINRYAPGMRMALHRDDHETDLQAPIVSVSLGLCATFLLGGVGRRDPVQRVLLAHGDVIVWGGPARLVYHGILPIKPGFHALLGECRINLTFRMAQRYMTPQVRR